MKILPGKSNVNWKDWKSYDEILLHKCDEGIARIAINRPEKRNAFTPQTIDELCDAFNLVKYDKNIGVVLFTGAGPDKKGVYSFCSGGDQSVRGSNGYKDSKRWQLRFKGSTRHPNKKSQGCTQYVKPCRCRSNWSIRW